MSNLQTTPSTRPYLIRALHDWCTDNGLTPYVAVKVDDSVRVPREYVKNGEIVLNVSFDATSSLKLGNEFIEFKARFGGVARDIMVPIQRVIAIYARESGQGMAFPLEGETEPPSSTPAPVEPVRADSQNEGEPAPPVTLREVPGGNEPDPNRPSGGARPSLRRIK